MSVQHIKELIERYLSETEIMQLATVFGGKPWICSLHFAVDDDSNIFWISNADSLHSHEIAANPNVAIVIAVKTDKPLIGIQAEGLAKLVSDPKVLRTAMDKYINRHGTDRSFADQIIAGTNEHKLYMFTPKRYCLFDQANFPSSSLNEWIV